MLFQTVPSNVIEMSKRFNDISILRRLAAIVCISIVGASNLLDMYVCSLSTNHRPENYFSLEMANALQLNGTHAQQFDQSLNDKPFASEVCKQYPSYFSNFSILILIATTLVSQLTHLCKFGLMLLVAGNQQKKIPIEF